MPPDRSAPDAPPGPAVLAAACLLLFVLGLALGAFGALLIPAGPRIGSVLLSAGVAVALVGNLVAGRLGVAMTGSRLGAAVAGIGWLVAVLPLGATRPEGDLVVTGDTKGFSFLLVGMITAVATAAVPPLTRPRRR